MVQAWHREHQGRPVIKAQFGELFNGAYGVSATVKNATSGFRAGGICTVEVRLSSVVGMEMTSLHAVPTKPRFSSFSAPWAGPCVPLPLSLIVVGRQALRGPASEEVDREETFPSLESPMADDGCPTN